MASATPARLRKSRHLSWFAHMDAVYLFHDLYGYLMEMSADIAQLIEAFRDGVATADVVARYQGRFGEADPAEFVDVLAGHAVLVEPDEDELEGMWPFVPIKGKWNVWRRRGDRLTLWTAWGDNPVQQLFLDADETRMWDAFDGNARLNELRMKFDPAALRALVQRLVHSDVQALKLSMMPWAAYAKRPGSAPPYLASTMPFGRWRVGEPVPGRPLLADYHRNSIPDADAQFDHQETTLSHLLRVPHPALRGRTYGQALAETLLARGAVPDGRVRILEIGAGLGYVARDVIARLRAEGREVDYTIVELSHVLAAAQQERLGDRARWLHADALTVELPEAPARLARGTDSPIGHGDTGAGVGGSGGFDLVLANEMVGDLPARWLHRRDLGLSDDGTGTVDADKVRALGGGAALAADWGVRLDDAPEPCWLQTGAFELIARIARWLVPGGTAVVTEFGELAGWPKLSSHLDHPELSTHFGHLEQAARGAGLEAKVEFVIDLLDFDRNERGLVTTRSQFRALRALAADAGVDLPKIGFTPELLAATCGDKLDLATVGELRYDRVEDRLMGLVPHEFKALVARRGA
ncbi:MAG: SAM-dependent methyltransferase [Deltaproteobacteria bacterium]|nr:SAM-dependent methyltransferase [Deltaproteobacteria bacterium]